MAVKRNVKYQFDLKDHHLKQMSARRENALVRNSRKIIAEFIANAIEDPEEVSELIEETSNKFIFLREQGEFKYEEMAFHTEMKMDFDIFEFNLIKEEYKRELEDFSRVFFKDFYRGRNQDGIQTIELEVNVDGNGESYISYKFKVNDVVFYRNNLIFEKNFILAHSLIEPTAIFVNLVYNFIIFFTGLESAYKNRVN